MTLCDVVAGHNAASCCSSADTVSRLVQSLSAVFAASGCA
jgi:hypothetical protein